ncbi:Hydrolase, NUDIX family [Propionibacterium freudenreichii]|uniref:NUDIX domain-containing protein n=1 Tax=Propionibacterium freudenreichii TaxID=1744 RepID=UPI000BC33D26|nr:NUDIX hydrolase [Propionibacterium freudenreichii]SBT29064.1 Hydrolase, NUDIX family [Propionibacterium freudenreichii]
MSELVDRSEHWPILSHRVEATGRVCDFVEDKVAMPDGDVMTRQWVTHPGAVAIMALDDHQRVAVVDQYRHPVAMRLVEPPAGLLDKPGEPPLSAAKRELAEEAMLAADDWRTLVDIFTSPGGLEESIRIYLARGLHPVPHPAGFVVEDEELDMDLAWLSLDELVTRIYAGQIENPNMVTGTLALRLAILDGRLDALRPADAPWPARAVRAERRKEIEALG